MEKLPKWIQEAEDLQRLRTAEEKVRSYLHGTPIEGDVFDYLINLNNINLVKIETLRDEKKELQKQITELEDENSLLINDLQEANERE